MSNPSRPIRARVNPKPILTKPLERTAAADGVDDFHQDLLADSLAYSIKRAQVRCDEALRRYLDPGVSPARFGALSTIGANPGISQTELGSLLNIAAPSVVRVVDDLEGMGLLRRDRINGRLHSLQLTKKGASDLRRYSILVAQFESEIAAALTAAERRQLLDLLKKVAPSEP
jgi:DNA-binding MarR family transcriptional regulator